MVDRANRGMGFESLLYMTHELYRSRGIANIVKVPTEFLPIRKNGAIVSAKVTKKSGCDYLGCVDGVPVALEAKSTASDVIRKSALEPHQREFLHDWEKCGGKSFLILSYRLQDFVVVPFSVWETLKGGLKVDDFSPESRLRAGGRAPVDYIGVVKRFLK